MTQKPIDEDGEDLDLTARSPAASPAAAGCAEGLLPCPFCGREAKLDVGRGSQAVNFDDVYRARCWRNACAESPWSSVAGEAIAWWNTRSPSSDGAQANSAERVNNNPPDTSVSAGEDVSRLMVVAQGELDAGGSASDVVKTILSSSPVREWREKAEKAARAVAEKDGGS